MISRVLACCLVALSASPFTAPFKTFGLTPITMVPCEAPARWDGTANEALDLDPASTVQVDSRSLRAVAGVVAEIEPPVALVSGAYTSRCVMWVRVHAPSPPTLPPSVLRV